MQYEVTNIYYGTKMTLPSKEALDKFLAAAKTDKPTNKKVWYLSKELEDVTTPSREGELLQELQKLQDELAAMKGDDSVSMEAKADEQPSDEGASPSISTKTAPKKKAKK